MDAVGGLAGQVTQVGELLASFGLRVCPCGVADPVGVVWLHEDLAAAAVHGQEDPGVDLVQDPRDAHARRDAEGPREDRRVAGG
ncbi:MAG: hypothetical protein WD250_09525 [Egibacteraceae bacterium]